MIMLIMLQETGLQKKVLMVLMELRLKMTEDLDVLQVCSVVQMLVLVIRYMTLTLSYVTR